jgi:hypothetical protein
LFLDYSNGQAGLIGCRGIGIRGLGVLIIGCSGGGCSGCASISCISFRGCIIFLGSGCTGQFI